MIGLPTALVAAGLAAASAQSGPLPGPGQVVHPVPPPPADDAPQPQVIIVPITPAPDRPADELEEFDALDDPATDSTAGLPGEPAAAETAAPASDDAAALALFEEELALELRPASDPLEGFNRISFAISMAIDKALLRPLSLAFQAVVPKPLRDGMRNLLSNWGEPMVFLNDILQLKPMRALRTLGRFLLNTALGVGGLFDIAKDKKFNLPHHPNRFSDTLGFYGVKPGPYVYLPILGPTTLRDQADRFQGFVPLFDNPIFRGNRGIAFTVASGLEQRANNDQALEALLEDAVDPYATFRETWLQEREGQLERLKAPDGAEPGSVETSPLDDPLTDPLAGPVAEPEGPADIVPDVVTPAP
jgi:phospholipid-binding lipoprotein MlaA